VVGSVGFGTAKSDGSDHRHRLDEGHVTRVVHLRPDVLEEIRRTLDLREDRRGRRPRRPPRQCVPTLRERGLSGG